MDDSTQRDRDPGAVPIEEGFLAIPDDENEAINDARNAFDISLISVVVFVAIVFVFVL
jgi:hypothetical protein